MNFTFKSVEWPFHESKMPSWISLLKVWSGHFTNQNTLMDFTLKSVWSGHFTFGNACILPMKNLTLQKRLPISKQTRNFWVGFHMYVQLSAVATGTQVATRLLHFLHTNSHQLSTYIYTSLNPVPNAQVCVYLTVHITKLQLQTTFPKPLYIPHCQVLFGGIYFHCFNLKFIFSTHSNIFCEKEWP